MRDWPLNSDEYRERDGCDKNITGRRLEREIDMNDHPEVNSIGVSGGRIELDIKNVTEEVEIHIWGYRIDIAVYCDERVDIPVHVNSTRKTVETLPDKKKQEIYEIKDSLGSTSKNEQKKIEEIKDKYTKRAEREATRRVDVLVFNGKAIRQNIPNESSRIKIDSTTV